MTRSTARITIETKTKTTIKRLTVSHAAANDETSLAKCLAHYDAVVKTAERLDEQMDLVWVVRSRLGVRSTPDVLEVDVGNYWGVSDAHDYATKKVRIETRMYKASFYYASAQDKARREAKERSYSEMANYRADQGEVIEEELNLTRHDLPRTRDPGLEPA